MPIKSNNRERIQRIINAKIKNGLSFAALAGSEIYRDGVAEKTHATFPTGPFDPPHSRPGDFPDRETGQGHDSIEWAIHDSGRKAAFGVQGKAGAGPRGDHQIAGGMHLIWLTRHGRKGPVDVVQDNREDLAREFIAGAEATR